MRLGKSAAFVICTVCISAMFLILAGMKFLGKADGFPIGVFLTAIVSMGTAYIGLEVTNNGVRGKCFNENIAKLDATNQEGRE